MNWKKAEEELIPLVVYNGVKYVTGFPREFLVVLVDKDKSRELLEMAFPHNKVSIINNTIQLFEDDYNFVILTREDAELRSFSKILYYIMGAGKKKKLLVVTRQVSVWILVDEVSVNVKYIPESKIRE